MVNEPAFEEAVSLARSHPRLGVGLHLSLLCGRAALDPSEIPGLANASGGFTENPVAAGMRYFFLPHLREQLRKEIRAQFARFKESGLPLDHVNGHLHMHLHPTVFRILQDEIAAFRFNRMRLTRDPLLLNLRIAGGFYAYRLSHALIFGYLSGRARSWLQRNKVLHTERVFGLLQNGRVDEDYVLRLLQALPSGDSELYSHPSVDEFRNEFEALISPRVLASVREHGIELIRYQDL
ncbi:Chitooligosaccharide deacetylase [bioreactor metagenome]|uniref:Chitooligosaccharide deacetylase n=1 Tax=bioreactor metagenome TaxID=1076179 RepID=A0A645DYJ3_9ZZZZ